MWYVSLCSSNGGRAWRNRHNRCMQHSIWYLLQNKLCDNIETPTTDQEYTREYTTKCGTLSQRHYKMYFVRGKQCLSVSSLFHILFDMSWNMLLRDSDNLTIESSRNKEGDCEKIKYNTANPAVQLQPPALSFVRMDWSVVSIIWQNPGMIFLVQFKEVDCASRQSIEACIEWWIYVLHGAKRCTHHYE